MSNESEIEKWVKGLENLGLAIETGDREDKSIFVRHEARYLEIARRVGGQVLLVMIPDGVDPQEWGERVSDFVDLIFTRKSTGGKAMEIIYAGRADDDAPSARQVPVTYADVLEWVQAGVENGGKDKTAVENTRNRSDEQIAYDVNTALRQQRLGIGTKDYTAITERLERWVESRVLNGDFPGMLVAVLDAWYHAVGVAMERDLGAWGVRTLRGSFR